MGVVLNSISLVDIKNLIKMHIWLATAGLPDCEMELCCI